MADEQAGLEFDKLTQGGVAEPLQLQPGTLLTEGEDAGMEFDRLVGRNVPPNAVSAFPNLSTTQLIGRRGQDGQYIPIDTVSGFMETAPPLSADEGGLAPVGRYWRLSQQSDPEAQAAVLQKMYPGKAVRVLDTGDVTLEITDPTTGKPKDVVLNPQGVDAHDLFDLAAQAPEIAAQIATAVATRGRGALRTAAQMVLSALAGGTAGAARDIASRSAEGIPVRLGDIARQRGAESTLSLAGETGLLGLGKASRAFSPFATEAKPNSLAFNMREGLNALREGYETDLRVTPAEKTGSKALMAVEAAESPMPGARNVFDALKAERSKAIQGIQQKALQGLKPDEELGQAAANELRSSTIEPVEWAFGEAREHALAKGNKKLAALIDEVIPAGTISKHEAGQVAEQAFARRVERANALRDEAYAKVRALPGGSGDVLGGTAAADAAAEIRAELPAVLKEMEVPTNLVDEAGNPITRSVEKRVELKGGEPEQLERALLDMEKLRGGKVSLSTLTELKNRAHDAIAAFRTAHGDVKDRWFSRIAGGYERAIQEGIDATENLELKQALAEARDTYKKEVLPLERPGIKELAKDEFDPGKLAPEEIVNRFFEGPKATQNYKMLEETLGADNVAFKAMKRAWVNTKLGKFTDTVTGRIDADAFGAMLKDMSVERPELAKAIFGKNVDDLLRHLRLQGSLEKAGIKSIDQTELSVLTSLKDPTVDDLKAVLRMGANRDKVYANKILDDLRQGDIKGDYQPAKFVQSLRNTDISTAQVEEVLSKLSPEVRQGIATAEFYRILNAGTVTEAETLAQRASGGVGNLSPSKIVNAMGKDAAERQRTALLLGDNLPAPGSRPPKLATGGEPQKAGMNRADTLLALVKTLAPKEAANTVFSGLGSVASATAVRQVTRGPLTYAGNFVKNWFTALLYTTKLGESISNTVWDAEGSALLANTLIASEPFLRASVETFGEGMTKQMVEEAKSSIDKWVMELNDSPAGRKRQATRQFLQGQQVPMRLEAKP